MSSDREQVEHLTIAVERRTEIGIAIGMLMERLNCNRDQAFQFLARCSQHQQRKLYDIAVEFTATRTLPHAGPAKQD